MAKTKVSAQTKAAAELAAARRIMNDEREARHFFYSKMRPKNIALAATYNNMFSLDLTEDSIATVTYEECMADDWQKFRNFKGEITLTGWTARIATQAVYSMLVEERFIEPVSRSKATDYRLKLLSISDEYLRREIVNLVEIPEMNRALTLHYVDKAKGEAFYRHFACKAEADRWLRLGETTLIEQLLNTINPYADIVLSLRKTPAPVIRFEQWHDSTDEDEQAGDNREMLRQALSQITGSDNHDKNVSEVLDAFVEETFVKTQRWSARQAEVWRRRFFFDMPSAELAEIYGVRPSYIDNMYFHLKNEFNIAIKQWWEANK